MAPENAIETAALSKRFGALTAVDGVSLAVHRGELFGLLGPNGAGKTTLLSMLCTILPPTSGTATVNGHDIRREPAKVRRSIGIVFQEQTLDELLTGRENLDLHGRLYGMGRRARERRGAEVLELVELADRADELVKRYSGGMRRRLELARGLLHRPELLFLDEPTLGLDPQTRRHIWDYLQRLNRESGMTMVLTTHYMEEADLLCHRIGIIDSGRIVALDTPRGLKTVVGGDLLNVRCSDGARLAAELQREHLASDARLVEGGLSLRVEGGEALIPRVVEAARRAGVGVEAVELRRATLEDVFIQYTGRTIREEDGGEAERKRLIRMVRGR